MSVIAFILTALILGAAAFLGFFMLLMGLNGFSESDAQPGIIFYIVAAILDGLIMSSLAAFVTIQLVKKKSLNSIGAAAISTVSFSVIGGAILFVIWVAGIIITSFMHGR